MDKQILNFTVNEQILVCENPIKISTNKVNYIQASFDLGENWSGFDSVRAVWFNDFNCISTVLDSLGNCAVPFEVMKRKGNVKVNLVGSISEDDVLTDRLTSYPVVAVIVDCTAQITGANTSPITPSEYEQFVAAVHEDAERAEAGATASEQSAQNAHASEQNASQSAQSAHDDKIAIEEAIAEVIQQIEDFEQVQVVVNTLPPTSPATSDFTDGVLTLGIPQGVKGDTGNGIQSIRKTGISGLVDTYTITYTDGQTTTFTVTNGAKGDTGNGISSIEKTSTVGLVDTYTITYTDGTTTTFTVTNGEKGDKGDTGEVSLSELEDATIVQVKSDTEPYHFRQTNAGQGCGHREYDEIVGASVGWCQLAKARNGAYQGISAAEDSDGVITLSGTATTSYANFCSSFTKVYKNVYLITWEVLANPNNLPIRPTANSGVVVKIYDGNAGILVGNNSASPLANFGADGMTSGADYTGVKLWINITDLTLFNSAIADYVYSLETATAGSGVAWLKSHFPKLFDNGYQPYDSGSIQSVSGLVSHDMVGFNQWDEEWELGSLTNGVPTPSTANIRGKNYTAVFPSTEYFVQCDALATNARMYLAQYDGDKNFISYIPNSSGIGGSRSFVTDSKCRYLRFVMASNYGKTYNNDICINLSDASKNGTYEQYQKHSYPLDSTITLRGKLKLQDGKLYADGDVYPSSGEGVGNWREFDIPSATVNIRSDPANENGVIRFTCNTTDKKHGEQNVISSHFPTHISVIPTNTADELVSGYSGGSGTYISIKASRLSGDLTTGAGRATAFKNWCSANNFQIQYELATPTTFSATPYTNPQTCDPNGTEEYVSTSIVPIGHNTDYPMSLVDTMPTTNGTFEPRVTVTNGVRTVTWVSV